MSWKSWRGRWKLDQHEDIGVCSVALRMMLGGEVMVNGMETMTGRRVDDAVIIQDRMTEVGPRPHRAEMREESRDRYDFVLEYVG